MITPKVSVIIPVYNVEKYVSACLDSMLLQDYPNMELVVVNDGSTDGSAALCEQYAARHTNIKLIHQENGGLSAARNTGIRSASGEYLLFCDSDDYLSEQTVVSRLVAHIREYDADVVLFRYKKLYDSTGKYVETTQPVDLAALRLLTDPAQRLKFLSENMLYISSACTKFIKREFILRHNLFFPVGANAEDIEWSALVAIHARRMEALNDCFYVYRQRSQSLSHTVKYSYLVQLHINICNCIHHGEQLYPQAFREAYWSYAAYQVAILFSYCSCFSRGQSADVRKGLADCTYVFAYSENPKVRMIRAASRLFGINGCLWLLRLYNICQNSLHRSV